MKKIIIASLILFATSLNAQNLCPCEMDNKTDALLAVAMTRASNNNIDNPEPILTGSDDLWSAVTSIVGTLFSQMPEGFSYVLKIKPSDGPAQFAEVKYCQYCLEYTYEILQIPGIEYVKIVAGTWVSQVNPSCNNKTYKPSDLKDVKRRSDENFNYEILNN